jgi:hypothetical protein
MTPPKTELEVERMIENEIDIWTEQKQRDAEQLEFDSDNCEVCNEDHNDE